MAGAPEPDSTAPTDHGNAPGDGGGGEAVGAALLISGGDVVTMNARREVLVGGTVAIAGDRIVAVGATSALRAAYPGAGEVDATGCIVTPGLINAHQHLTGDPLVSGCIPDLLAPGESIFSWAVPLHAQHTGDDDELSATLESARSAVEEAGAPIASAEVVMRATNTVPVDTDQAGKLMRLIDSLEDLDDVQRVFTNANFPDAALVEA